MLNHNGMLAVLDRHITLNWDDGPTLMRIGAEVRYQVAGIDDDDDPQRTLMINASSRCGDDPPCFNAFNEDDGITATWTWVDGVPTFSSQLTIGNIGDDDLRLTCVALVAIDGARNGVFNLGAPPSLWSTLSDDAQASSQALAAPDGSRTFVVYCDASTRSRPTALAFAVRGDTLGARFELRTAQDRFQALRVAIDFSPARLLGAGATMALPEVLITSGDDPRELRDAV
jgi:hypothetical protein